MCVCVCVCVHVCMHICACVYAYMCMCVCIYVHVCVISCGLTHQKKMASFHTYLFSSPSPLLVFLLPFSSLSSSSYSSFTSSSTFSSSSSSSTPPPRLEFSSSFLNAMATILRCPETRREFTSSESQEPSLSVREVNFREKRKE